MTKEDAHNISDIIKVSFHGHAIPIESRHVVERVLCLPLASNIVLKCEIDTNSVAEVILVGLVVSSILSINVFLKIKKFLQ